MVRLSADPKAVSTAAQWAVPMVLLSADPRAVSTAAQWAALLAC
jgi:hypothetical protein